MKDRKLLTKSEYQVMHILWNLAEENIFTNTILAEYNDPKPAYTTLATFLKILTNKGFVKSHKLGVMLTYTPLVTKEEYADMLAKYEREDFFGNDIAQQISFLIDHQEMTNEQIDEIIAKLQEKRG